MIPKNLPKYTKLIKEHVRSDNKRCSASIYLNCLMYNEFLAMERFAEMLGMPESGEGIRNHGFQSWNILVVNVIGLRIRTFKKIL